MLLGNSRLCSIYSIIHKQQPIWGWSEDGGWGLVRGVCDSTLNKNIVLLFRKFPGGVGGGW